MMSSQGKPTLLNYFKKTSGSSLPNNTSADGTKNEQASNKSSNETKSKFVFKSKSTTSTTWTPPLNKQTFTPQNLKEPRTSQSNSIQESPTILPTYKAINHGISTNTIIQDDNQSNSMFSMEVDDMADLPEFHKGHKSTTPIKNKSNTSIRISSTPSPPRNKPASKTSDHKKVLKTPEKESPKDRDPLKNIKLDQSIMGFLNTASKLPGLNSKESQTENEDREKCKDIYIELLEKIYVAFDRIPNCIKEKFPGYDKKVYAKVKQLKYKLKRVLDEKPANTSSISQKSQSSAESRLSNGDSINGKASPSLLNHYDDDIEDFDLEPSRVINKKLADTHINKLNNIETSTPAFLKQNGPTKSIYTELSSKKSLAFDAMSPLNDSSKVHCLQSDSELDTSDNVNKPKGKFVFKKPSRLTIEDNKTPDRNIPSTTAERLRTLSEKLKPIQPKETPKITPIANSSVNFQPPPFNKDSIFDTNTTTNKSNIDDDDNSDPMDLNDDYEVPVDIYDDTDFNSQLPDTSKTSVINIDDDSIASISNVDISKNIPIDDDGWPEYNPEDFEDNFEDKANEVGKEAEVVNLMEVSHVKEDSTPKYEGMGDFHAGTQNDGVTGEFDGLDYPHSAAMMETFSEKFGLKSFRPNQLQVINATLLGHDCFVLMPTGGGKSLCYQLPAIMTPGVTIVISPLKSLILDQVNKLLSLDIPAAHLSGDVSLAACDEIYHKLSVREPLIKLLYVTPEKVIGSPKFQAMLDALYARGKLARFVIDEAHCVSQWGHDFRPDYKRLSVLRARFPSACLMALTATATPRVRMDILHQLKVTKCKWFLCSFNRPNLAYSILEKKPKSINQDIAKLIKEKFFRLSGIVYCLSRKECESLSTDLRKTGIQAAAYHAGLSDKKREEVQAGWVADKYNVICATIAFGMGVDKADVRYVLHHSLPRSVEGYYQEAGRAGRDGAPATCALYYAYSDVIRHRRLLDMERNATAEAKRVHIENLLRMVELCESVTECRRAQVLAYLGERFSRELCLKNKRTACDNCLNATDYKPVDVTDECKLIVQCIGSASRGGRSQYTLLHVVDALRGSKQQRLQALQQTSMFGKCKSWSRSDAARLLRQLVVRGVLQETLVVNNDIASAYVALGPSANKVLSGAARIVFPLRLARGAAPATAPASEHKHEPLARIVERCYADLVEACREMGSARGASLAAVLPQAALKAMSVRLPETPEEMRALPYVTRANYDKYGAKLLAITAAYAQERLGYLMVYQDELEQQAQEAVANEAAIDSSSEPEAEWPAASTSRASTSSGRRGRTYRGGVRKKFKRKKTSSPKKKALRGTFRGRGRGTASAGSSRASTPRASVAGAGNKLGSMPVPRANTAILNTRPGVFKPSKLNLI